MSPKSADSGGLSEQATIQLDPHPTSVREARVFVKRVCASTGVDGEVREVVAVLTSEVVTNALLHGRSLAIGLSVTITPGRVLVEVSDDNCRLPQIAEQEVHALDGRGLAIVDALASHWGTYQRPPGKVVWFEVPA